MVNKQTDQPFSSSQASGWAEGACGDGLRNGELADTQRDQRPWDGMVAVGQNGQLVHREGTTHTHTHGTEG